jgi:hypothetical protein
VVRPAAHRQVVQLLDAESPSVGDDGADHLVPEMGRPALHGGRPSRGDEPQVAGFGTRVTTFGDTLRGYATDASLAGRAT